VKRFTGLIDTVEAILGAVDEGEGRWTPVVRSALRTSTPWRVHATIYWLLDQGYLTRPSRGVYKVTERGRLLLQALGRPGSREDKTRGENR
jgi:hypothetical protein